MSLANNPETLNVEVQKREVDREVPEVPPCDWWSNEPPVNSDLHLRQIALLIQSLEHRWHDRHGSCATYWHKRKPRWLRLQHFWHAIRSDLANCQKARKVYFGSSSCSVRAR